MSSKYPYRQSDSGGVKVFSIRGIFEDERYRISEEYTPEDRKWRHQWFKDQILAPDEPRHVPELERELKNPIRRFFSYPWKVLETQMTPVVGAKFSKGFRYFVPRLMLLTFGVYWGYYFVKYNQSDWTRVTGVQFRTSRPTAVPGDPGYPLKRERFEPSDYNDLGFKSRKVFLDKD